MKTILVDDMRDISFSDTSSRVSFGSSSSETIHSPFGKQMPSKWLSSSSICPRSVRCVCSPKALCT